MTTARDIVGRALQRIRIVVPGDSVPAQLAADGLSALNDMLASWQGQGMYVSKSDFVLSDEFWLLVPGADIPESVIAALDYQGGWNADTDTPVLSDELPEIGAAYRVTTAGATSLGDLDPEWSVGEIVISDGATWLRSPSSARFDRAVTDLLALELCPLYGREPPALIAQRAEQGWRALQAALIKPATAVFDPALVLTAGRRATFTTGVDGEDISQYDIDGGGPST